MIGERWIWGGESKGLWLALWAVCAAGCLEVVPDRRGLEDGALPDEGLVDGAQDGGEADAEVEDAEISDGGLADGGLADEGPIEDPDGGPRFEAPTLAPWPETRWVCDEAPALCAGWQGEAGAARPGPLPACEGALSLPEGCGCQRLSCPEGWQAAGRLCEALALDLEDPLAVPGGALQPLQCTLGGNGTHGHYEDSPVCVTTASRCDEQSYLVDLMSCASLRARPRDLHTLSCLDLREGWATPEAHAGWIHVASTGRPDGAGTLADPVSALSDVPALIGDGPAQVVILDALSGAQRLPRLAAWAGATLCGAPCPQGDDVCEALWPTPAYLESLSIASEMPQLGYLHVGQLTREPSSQLEGRFHVIRVDSELAHESEGSSALSHCLIEGLLAVGVDEAGATGSVWVAESRLNGGLHVQEAAASLSTVSVGPSGAERPSVLAERSGRLGLLNVWIDTDGMGIEVRGEDTRALMRGVHIAGDDGIHGLYVHQGASAALNPLRSGAVRGGLSMTGRLRSSAVKVDNGGVICGQLGEVEPQDCAGAVDHVGQISLDLTDGAGLYVGEGGTARLADVAIRGGFAPAVESLGRLDLRALSIEGSRSLPGNVEDVGDDKFTAAVAFRGGSADLRRVRISGDVGRIDVEDASAVGRAPCPYQIQGARWLPRLSEGWWPGGLDVDVGCAHLTDALIERQGSVVVAQGNSVITGGRFELRGEDLRFTVEGGEITLDGVKGGAAALTGESGEIRLSGFELSDVSADLSGATAWLRHGALRADPAGPRRIGGGGILVVEDVAVQGAAQTLQIPLWQVAEAGRLDVRGSRIEGLGAQTALAVARGGQARLEHVYVEGAQVKTAQVAGAAVFENTRLVGGEATLPGRPVAMEISGEAALSCVAVTAHEVGLSLDGGAAWVDQVWIEAATACEGAGCPPLGE